MAQDKLKGVFQQVSVAGCKVRGDEISSEITAWAKAHPAGYRKQSMVRKWEGAVPPRGVPPGR